MAVAFFAFVTTDSREFVIQLTNDDLIAHARKLLSGEETSKPHGDGKIIKGSQPYNPAWSFHLDPDTIAFFEQAIEVCDANTTYVEDHLEEVCGVVLPGCHWCPWSSKLTREVG